VVPEVVVHLVQLPLVLQVQVVTALLVVAAEVLVDLIQQRQH
jgi:hypothetical protein